MTVLRRFILLFILLSSSLSPAVVQATEGHSDDEYNRAKLVGYIFRQQLARHHFSHKEIDDSLSKAAFDLYLKQLDFQKRFLLKKDVARLEAFSARIDDEINLGEMELPQLGAQILNQRIEDVRGIVKEIFTKDFDFTKDESMETDPEKLEWCDTLDELKDRWRKVLKYQVLNRYLNILEEETGKKNAGQDAAKKKNGNGNGKSGEKGEDPLVKARKKIQQSNEEFFSRMLKETLRDHFDRYFNAVARAYDPHTNYMPPSTKEDFDISMRGSLEGIGALLREEDGYIKVVRVIPGSAAARQGQLQAEDIILQVAEGDGDPVEVTDMRLRDAVSLIRGQKGTTVRLTVKKSDASVLSIPIVRDVVQIEETFVKSTTVTEPATGAKYGYIRIPSFYRDFEEARSGGTGRNSTDDVKAALEALKKENVVGLVLDLRNNGGGALTDAVSIAGLFFKSGPVVQVKNANGRMRVIEDEDDGIAYKGPMVVLVNKFSASASEILAGALQDYGRAVIVGGDHTHGKGTVQTMLDLDRSIPLQNMERFKPLGALKITIQKFYRVSGGSTQYRGVVPDIILPDGLQGLETGEQYLDYSLPWDTVDPVSFDTWTGSGPGMAALKAKSGQRVAGSEKFKEISQAAAKAGERRKQTMVSLQIGKVKKEREELRKGGKPGSPHGGGDGGDSFEDDMDADSKPIDDAAWIKEVGEDAYVGEAMAILFDISSARADVAGSDKGAAQNGARP